MLGEFVDEVATHRRTVTVFAPEPDEALESYFETRNVTVEYEPLPDDGSGGFVVVTVDGEFVGSLDMDSVQHLVSPSDSDLEFGPYERIRLPMNLLADTTFVSFDKRQLLAATREIEERAYRRERGTLRSGFQSLSNFVPERRTYEVLASNTRLGVHVYGRPDHSVEVPDATIHVGDDPEITDFWFVVFDGGGDDQQACALVAQELSADSGSFRGFWTYDPEVVADIDAYLGQTYG